MKLPIGSPRSPDVPGDVPRSLARCHQLRLTLTLGERRALGFLQSVESHAGVVQARTSERNRSLSK